MSGGSWSFGVSFQEALKKKGLSVAMNTHIDHGTNNSCEFYIEGTATDGNVYRLIDGKLNKQGGLLNKIKEYLLTDIF